MYLVIFWVVVIKIENEVTLDIGLKSYQIV